METYIVIKDKKILRVYQTSDRIDGIHKSVEYEKLEYDEIIQVSNDYEGQQGMNVGEIEESGKILPLVDRIKAGYVDLDPKMKIVDNEITPKTLQEAIEEGLITIPPEQIYDEKSGEIRHKTMEELYTPEQLKDIEREKIIQEELRAMAIERLVKAGKLTK